jgi:hypothetical protein
MRPFAHPGGEVENQVTSATEAVPPLHATSMRSRAARVLPPELETERVDIEALRAILVLTDAETTRRCTAFRPLRPRESELVAVHVLELRVDGFEGRELLRLRPP